MLNSHAAPTPIQRSVDHSRLIGGGLYPPLAGRRVLLIEDDYQLAVDLASEMEEFGVTIIGPCPTIEAAVGVLAETTPDYAVLDINIRGRAVFGVADELLRKDVRFIFYTGYDASLLPRHLVDFPCLTKPAGATAVARALSHLPPPAHSQSEVATLLPALRRRAVLATGDADEADRLVEKALRQAISAHHLRPVEQPLQTWIEELLERTALEEGFRYWQ